MRTSYFCPVVSSLYVQVIAFSYIGSVTARHCSSGRQPNFAAYGTRNGITELSQTAPPICGGTVWTDGATLACICVAYASCSNDAFLLLSAAISNDSSINCRLFSSY